ncbi:hypothetical protein J4462_00885 [Candidatus Pacearchaeota archaeon]|nr:hypothetical protein [Candidatus Pacearchaeota archaeon]
MTNINLAVPEDLQRIMERHRNVKWAEVARQAMWQRARKLELMDKLLSKSELTEQDSEEIGNKIKHGIARRHGLVK